MEFSPRVRAEQAASRIVFDTLQHPEHTDAADYECDKCVALACAVVDEVFDDRNWEADYRSAQAQLDAMNEAIRLGEMSDGYHSFNELYEYRLLYNAHTALAFDHAGWQVVRSWRHSDGKDAFDGGWFVVHMETPAGQITNHYKREYWRHFDGIAEAPTAPEWDGHTPDVAAMRLEAAIEFLRQRFREMANRADLTKRAYARVCGERDKYMRRTAEWRSAALDGHEMPEDDAVAMLAQVRKIVLDDAALSNEMRMRRIVEALGVDDTRACTGCANGCKGCQRAAE